MNMPSDAFLETALPLALTSSATIPFMALIGSLPLRRAVAPQSR